MNGVDSPSLVPLAAPRWLVSLALSARHVSSARA